MDDKEGPPDPGSPYEDSGARNSFAPNDGYQYFDEEVAVNYERRRSSLRRNSSLVTDADFKNQAYGMLRKRKSPEPNFSDKVLYSVYRVTKIYIPISSILAVTDFTLDWRNAVQLMNSDKCSQKAFGSMMFSTVLVIPMVFAMIHKSAEEYDMWDMIFRGCFGVSQKDPFGDVEEEAAPFHVRLMAGLFYIIFSPFTHLVTQMSLHTNSAEKVEFYLEFDVRKGKVMKQLHLGCFTSYDGDELDRLKELQFRATHYVQYYIKYAKDRLRYCLIEDTLQFNIQFAMFLYNMFTAPNDHPSTFQYLASQSFMGFSVYPETKLMSDAFTYAGGLITSVLMLWQGYFQIERYHEQLNTRSHIGLIRVLALCFKTMIELFLPSISLVILMIKFPIVDNAQAEVMLTKCMFSDWFYNMLKFYVVFLIFFSFGINFLWSLIMNYTNRGTAGFMPILKETTRMSIYTACISVKYNRIANHEENVIEHEFVQDKRALGWLTFANFIKFIPMFVVVAMFVPKSIKKQGVTSYAVTNDPAYLSYLNRPLRYDSLERAAQVYPPFIMPNKPILLPNATGDPPVTTSICSTESRDCFEGYYDKFQNLETQKTSGRIVVFLDIPTVTLPDLPTDLDEGIMKISGMLGILNSITGNSTIKDMKHLLELRQKVANLITHDSAAHFVTTDKWYEVIVEHHVYVSLVEEADKPKLSASEFARYMHKTFYTTDSTSALRTKLLILTILSFFAYTITCVMSEPRFLTSKYFRSDTAWIKIMYPCLLPLVMSYIAMKIEFSAVDNQLKSFCRMYPDRVSSSKIVNFGLNEPFDCINGKHFQSVRRCSYGTVCFYDSRKSLDLKKFGDVTKLKRLTIYNNPMALAEEFIINAKGTPKRIEYVESGLIEIYKRLRTEPKLINTMCLVNDQVRESQFGDIFYDTRDSSYEEVILNESQKCQRVLGQMASNNDRMENFFGATYTEEVVARKEAMDTIDKADETFWNVKNEVFPVNSDNTTIFKKYVNSTDYVQRLKKHLNNELECYQFQDGSKSVYNRSTEGDFEMVGEGDLVSDDEYPFFMDFHESCSTGFRRCRTDKCDGSNFIESRTAKYLIKQTAVDATKSFLVFSANKEEAPLLINWPEQITLNPLPENEIKPIIAEFNDFTMAQLKAFSKPNYNTNEAESHGDKDAELNLPLFNPYYNFAFDVYGTNTIRDLRSIPFKRMGEALNEIHDNVGPWMIPYEPPNVGPAMTNSLPAFRLRNDETKLIGQKFEVDIINMPRHLRLDTSSSLWHYYIHAILFPFSAPLPWWTSEEDANKKTIQRHTFEANNSFMNNSLDGQTLYRQVSPIVSFLYTDISDAENPISNSYFNVPIWSKQEEYGDLTSDKFKDWKSEQVEYVKKQNETTPWDDATASLVDSSLDSACAINFNGQAKLFGVGPSGSDGAGFKYDMLQDTFGWDRVGYANRKRFRIDEDYLIYGPGGEGLKRTALNPVLMQYEFDNTLRTKIRELTYHGKNASKNYDDGMGYAIDQALIEDGVDPSTDEFKIPMTYYLFTNLMSHMWPKDYDYRYIMPYSYDFDVGAIANDSNNANNVPGEDFPLTKKCVDGEYEFIDHAGTATGTKMWCIGGPIAFDPNSKPGNVHDPANPHDLRDVVLGRVYKPQAEFIRDNTDFFPFMDLGDPFVNQEFVDSHAPFGLLHKFWDTPSRLKIYSTKTPYSHYKKRFDNNLLSSPVWYKPFVNVMEHQAHNLAHVNTYVADINITGTVVTNFWAKYNATGYHAKIKSHTDSAEYGSTTILQRMSEPKDSMLPVLNNRTAYDIENWQRVYTRKNKESLNPGWHFFGREWDFSEFTMAQKTYTSDNDFLDGNEYYSEILDMDYSLYNVLPNSPTYVRTSALTDREAECFMSQPVINERNYRKPIASAPGGNNRYCEPNIHYVISRPDFTKEIAKTIEEVQQFNPAAQKFDEKKTYTDFNYGDLHISKPCVLHEERAYIFAQVRRLKPFYYFYCDKWINDMKTEKVNLASDGGKISTRPCSKKVLDPLNRFQPWDTNPQTAFANREISSNSTENALLKRPFILTDPEIVIPYSLVFRYNGETNNFDDVTVLPSGISPRRGSCMSSVHYGALICFGGIIKGRVTNIAMALVKGEWKTSNDKDAGFISEMAMPIPLIDHTVIEVGKKLYIFGGKTLLSHFKSGSQTGILDRGRNFMQYGYRKDFPLPASRDDEFVDENTPFKAYHKVSGEQQYPPIFGNPEEYGILGHNKKVVRVGDQFSDFGDSYHVFAFTGLAADGGTGWQETRRPITTIKWGIHSSFYKRNYAYIFTPGHQSIISRYNVQRPDIIDDAIADGFRKRRSLNYVSELQGGKHSPNTGPFMNEMESKMLYVKNDDETYFPNDWSTVMGEYFANDYHSGQMCKMCDGPSRTISFQKLRDEESPFQMVETPDKAQHVAREQLSLVMEINHSELMKDVTGV